MASGNVVLRFVTGYVGKGVDMLKAAMSSTGRIVARSIGAMTDAFGKLGSLGGSQINKFVQELGNLGKLVAQGGVWGAAQFAVVKLFELPLHFIINLVATLASHLAAPGGAKLYVDGLLSHVLYSFPP